MKFMKFLVVALIGAYLTQIKCDDDIFDENVSVNKLSYLFNNK